MVDAVTAPADRSPAPVSEVGLFAWTFAEVAGRVAKTDPPHLFLTMARRPALFRGWLRFAARLMPRGRLPRRDTELVILRVAHLRGCATSSSTTSGWAVEPVSTAA